MYAMKEPDMWNAKRFKRETKSYDNYDKTTKAKKKIAQTTTNYDTDLQVSRL